jgi:phage shock protein E
MSRAVLAACLALIAHGVLANEIWIDVRSPAEYASGHLTHAVNIPHQEIAVRIAEITRDHNADIKVYCGIGVRAQIAKLQLESAGYKHVENAGGYADIKARMDATSPNNVNE